MTIAVSFYNTAPDKLAQQHAIIACLLQVCPKERRGCYTVSTADMMNATNMPATQVSKLSYIGHALSACVQMTPDSWAARFALVPLAVPFFANNIPGIQARSTCTYRPERCRWDWCQTLAV